MYYTKYRFYILELNEILMTYTRGGVEGLFLRLLLNCINLSSEVMQFLFFVNEFFSSLLLRLKEDLKSLEFRKIENTKKRGSGSRLNPQFRIFQRQVNK